MKMNDENHDDDKDDNDDWIVITILVSHVKQVPVQRYSSFL